MTTTLDPAYAAAGSLTARREPPLPSARGPLSAAVLDRLRGGTLAPGVDRLAEEADPYGEDLQLALYVGYELHYRGFAGVDGDAEWDPDLLGLRRRLENVFEAALHRDGPGGDDVDAVGA